MAPRAGVDTRGAYSYLRRRSIHKRTELVRRWLALAIGLAIAATALYLLAAGEPLRPVAAGPPGGEIDADSRARLERVLEEADRAEAQAR